MADHSPTGPVETGATMDYPEHEKTYSMFTALAKYGTLFYIYDVRDIESLSLGPR